MTEFQPVLPAETLFTDAEQAFIEESPPGFYPDNQNSNFGYFIRKIWCDQINSIADQMSIMYGERFVPTSEFLLDDWEIDLGLLVHPNNMTLAQRRANVLARLRTGAFTRTMRDGIIETFLLATFGTVIQFTLAGIPFVPEGVPFHAEGGDVTTFYKVIEDLTNFTYQVRILNTITPDEPNLRRALDRVTPAGISYTIVYVAVP